MGLLSVEAALSGILARCRPLGDETVPVTEALGRALAGEVVARRTLPPWDNSAMDGYALRAADVERAGTALRLTSTVHAGETPQVPVEAGCCVRVMTGAPLPPGADAVVMQERTRAVGEHVIIDEMPRHGQNVRRRGEDIAEGQRLLSSGTCLGVAEAGVLWSQGLTEVRVRRRPTVAIVSSGDELCDVGEVPNGRIVDTNTPVLAQLVKRSLGLPTVIGRAPDRLDALSSLVARGLTSDVLLVVAGASVGERDFTREALAAHGVTMDFWKVALKPGKPLAFGARGETLVFGLPGNPVSAMVTFELFVRPALRALQGLEPVAPLWPARAAEPLSKPAGLRHFVRARVEHRPDGLWALPLPNQSSGALTSAAGATHLISLDPEVTDVKVGDVVGTMAVSWSS